MKKICPFFLCFLLILTQAPAASNQDTRRFEEEKRAALLVTEGKPGIKDPAFLENVVKEEPQRYLQELSTHRIATFRDSVYISILLLGLEKKFDDYETMVNFLRKNAIVPAAVQAGSADAPLTKGVAAYIFCKALAIEGGVWMRLFGTHQRYALKELEYEGITIPGSPSEILSGRELVYMFMRSAEYLTRRPLRLQWRDNEDS